MDSSEEELSGSELHHEIPEGSSEDEEFQHSDTVLNTEDSPEDEEEDENGGEEGDSDVEEEPSETETLPKKKPNKLLAKPKKDRTGIVYLSRVPPGMKPPQIKHLLSTFGPINRIFLTPEDLTRFKNRKKKGGNKRRMFVDGWIEFERKKHAKLAVKALNTNIIGGKKSSPWHDDIWNLKYLSGFKWHNLTEKIAYENRIREQKMRAEISQLKRENNAYLERVESAKIDQRIAERKRKQAERDEKKESNASSNTTSASAGGGASSLKKARALAIEQD